MISFIFMSSIPKKQRILPSVPAVHAQQNFHFKKITGTLKINIFVLSWHEPSSYIKDQLPKIEFTIRGCLVFFFLSKMPKTVFDLKNSKKFFFSSFSSVLALKK